MLGIYLLFRKNINFSVKLLQTLKFHDSLEIFA